MHIGPFSDTSNHLGSKIRQKENAQEGAGNGNPPHTYQKLTYFSNNKMTFHLDKI